MKGAIAVAVTIIDVAREANVSPSTVSRVIADHPRISVKTKKKVREVMERLQYYPNFQARNLAARSTQTIGVVMANSATLAFQNPFFPEVIRGICTKAHACQLGIYLSTGGTEEEIFQEVVAMVQGRKVDGLILLYSRVDDKTLNYLRDMNFPFTIVGRPYEYEDQIDFVDNDNRKIAQDVVDYLVELNHKSIAFIGGDLKFVVSSDRLEGYQAALARHELMYQDRYFIHDFTFEQDGKEAIRQLMTQESPPTALVAHDDSVAYEIIRFLEELEIRVPEDVSIISFNNHALSEHVKPPLTSVDIHIFELGIQATELLLDRIKQPEREAVHQFVDTTLIVRDSCQSLNPREK